MSLDITLSAMRPMGVFNINITHNLTKMADEAGLYYYMWRPEEIGINTAYELIEPLKKGLALLEEKPSFFIKFNPSNGWGNYEGLLSVVREYLKACIENPDAHIQVSR